MPIQEPSQAFLGLFKMSLRALPLIASILTLSVAAAVPGLAQPGGLPPPAYGYQPYNDRNPTGFYHPNDMGYGQYVYHPRTTGHRFKAFSYRRFRGY